MAGPKGEKALTDITVLYIQGGNEQQSMGEHSNDITQELALLDTLSGVDYARQVERIAMRNEFYPLQGENGIYACGGERDKDFSNWP